MKIKLESELQPIMKEDSDSRNRQYKPSVQTQGKLKPSCMSFVMCHVAPKARFAFNITCSFHTYSLTGLTTLRVIKYFVII